MAWLAVAVELGILALNWIYHRYILDQPAQPRPPQVVLPTVAEGTPLPLIYGQVRVRTPILVWSGNYLAPGQAWAPIEIAPSTTTADHYSVDLLFVLGIPFNTPSNGTYFGNVTSKLISIWIGDTKVLLTGSFLGTNLQNFYGGPGVTSHAAADLSIAGLFYGGYGSQLVGNETRDAGPFPGTTFFGQWQDLVLYNSGVGGTSFGVALDQHYGFGNVPPQPGYRDQAVVFMHAGIGLTPYLGAVSFEVSCIEVGTPAGDDLNIVVASVDANPAAVIYDILTSPWGKCGLDKSLIDIASFQVAAATLLSEQHGYSRLIDQAVDAHDAIRDILAQIDAIFYQDIVTGKFVLKLVRNDYNPLALDDVNPDNAETPGQGWYSVQGWAEVPNQVRVTFLDRSQDYAQAVAIAQDQAVAVAQGGRLRTASVQYLGCCTPGLAQQLASRELAAIGRPMVKATLRVNRSFYSKRPGDVVTLTWPELGVSRMIMRIAAIDYGTLHDGRITLQVMRDVFDQKLGAFPPP